MSRLTAAQVISLGEYLEPDFEPSSLTVSQLLGVLGYHNIPYPTPYTKTKLAHVFNNEVKTRASKFKKERIKKENSIASEDGITDGLTGRPLGNKGKAPLTARRSSRRLSVNPIEPSSPTEPEPRPEPPKRRRSSAQPKLGGTSRRVAPVPAVVIEESEPEEEEVLPVKKVGRTKKLSSAGAQGRRVSQISGDDSGWEDNNIFQSGAESSSPARPSPVRPKVSRPSIAPRKSRKSTSAPPQMLSSPPKPAIGLHSPPQSPFRPSLPAIPVYKFPPPTDSRFTPIREFSPIQPTKHEEDQVDVHEAQGNNEVGIQADEVQVKQEKGSDIEEASSQIFSEVEGAPTLVEGPRPSAMQLFVRVLAWLCIGGTLYTGYNYKVESASIGYCDAGSNTSPALETVLVRRAAIEACSGEGNPFIKMPSWNNTTNPQLELEEPCPLPPLIPIPQPASCTKCPEHATCSQFNAVCDSGFLFKPNILLSFIPVSPSRSNLTTSHAPHLSESFFKAARDITSGLPGFGSVGLAPRCVEDPQRIRNIGALGKAIGAMLAKERGSRICRGDYLNESESPDSLQEALRWGIEVGTVRDSFRKKASDLHLAFSDDIFNEAIQQLTRWGGVFLGETEDGTRYLAHKYSEMGWACAITVSIRKLWAAWRFTVMASAFALSIFVAARLRIVRNQKEDNRVTALVQVALDTLRNQEYDHYTDPLTAPQPYLSSIQLRDVVLQDEHSLPTRRRLWERVERVVEANANVRANLEETHDGDEMRVWRWTGKAITGRTPARKEVDYQEDQE